MKKKFILLHGTLAPGQKVNDYFWMPGIARELKARGNTVWMPNLPNGEQPRLARWLSFVNNRCPFVIDEDTVIVSHSAGGPLVLALLEQSVLRAGRVIMVAGFWRKLPNDVAGAMLRKSYDWESIKAHCQEFFFINSDNDPWGCDSVQGREMRRRLGGELIVLRGEGHMGSITYEQPYLSFPLVLKLATQ